MRRGVNLLAPLLFCACGLVENSHDAAAPAVSGPALLVRDGDATYLATVGPDGSVGRLPLGDVTSLETSDWISDDETWKRERILWSYDGQALAHIQSQDATTRVTIRDARSWPEARAITEANVYDFPPEWRWLGHGHLFVQFGSFQWGLLSLAAETIATGEYDGHRLQSRSTLCSAVAPAQTGYSWVRADGEAVPIPDIANGYAFVRNGTQLVVQSSEPHDSGRDDIWFIHSPESTNVPYIDWAAMLPDGETLIMRLFREPGSNNADYVVVRWGDDVLLSSAAESRGAPVVLSLPGNERHQWITVGDQFWGLPYDPPTDRARILRVVGAPDGDLPSIEEYATIPAEPEHRSLIDDLFLARLDGNEGGNWSYLDLRLSNPEWVELPYRGQRAYRLGLRGVIFFESTSESWMEEPCADCRYLAVEDLRDPESRRLSGEVSGADLLSIADRASGWIRAAPDGSGVVTGTNNRLKIIRFDGAESPVEISDLDSPGAFSMPGYWPSETDDDERLLRCF